MVQVLVLVEGIEREDGAVESEEEAGVGEGDSEVDCLHSNRERIAAEDVVVAFTFVFWSIWIPNGYALLSESSINNCCSVYFVFMLALLRVRLMVYRCNTLYHTPKSPFNHVQILKGQSSKQSNILPNLHIPSFIRHNQPPSLLVHCKRRPSLINTGRKLRRLFARVRMASSIISINSKPSAGDAFAHVRRDAHPRAPSDVQIRRIFGFLLAVVG